MPAAAPAGEPARNVTRNLILFGLLAFVVVVVFFISWMTAGGGMDEQRQADAVVAEQARVDELIAGQAPEAGSAAELLRQQQMEAERAVRDAARAAVQVPATSMEPPPRADRLPAEMDPLLARGLAERIRPLELEAPRSVGAPQVSPAPAAATMANPLAESEVFDIGRPQPVVDRVVEGATGAQVRRDPVTGSVRPGDEREQSARTAGAARVDAEGQALEDSAVTRAQLSPTRYLLSEGSILDVVLVNTVNTQNPGPITLRVVSDVFDSNGERRLLIPRGTRLLGSYGPASNRVGLDRVPIQVNRIVFADGRSVTLGGAAVTDSMGAVGAPAEHHSNLLRAIGPSALVALLGVVVDREIGGQATGNTGESATQTVSQQIFPRIEERVAERFGSAQPYYTIEPGTRMNLVLSQDLSLAPVAARQAR